MTLPSTVLFVRLFLRCQETIMPGGVEEVWQATPEIGPDDARVAYSSRHKAYHQPRARYARNDPPRSRSYSLKRPVSRLRVRYAHRTSERHSRRQVQAHPNRILPSYTLPPRITA